MAENPLLPHRKLQELYKLMERCRTLESKQRPPFAREAILAATTIHLEAGDFLSSLPTDRSAAALAPATKSETVIIDHFATTSPRLLLAAATSRGQQLAASGLTLAYAHAYTNEPAWSEALAFAQAERLPFILCVADAPPARANRSTTALTWPNVDRVCRRLQLPTLTVDGEDAVALYRGMQEAALRCRTGLGCSVIWAMLSPAGTRPSRSQMPMARLQRYLAARDISLPG